MPNNQFLLKGNQTFTMSVIFLEVVPGTVVEVTKHGTSPFNPRLLWSEVTDLMLLVGQKGESIWYNMNQTSQMIANAN